MPAQQYIAQWPCGLIRTVSELKAAGMSRNVIHQAVKKKSLQSIGYGGYARGTDSISWQHGLVALQSKATGTLPMHFLGGAAALSFHHQRAIDISSSPPVFFYVVEKRPFPAWFKYLVGQVVEFSGAAVQFSPYRNRLPLQVPGSFTYFTTAEGHSYQVSAPERALLESPLTQKNFLEIHALILRLSPLRKEILTTILQKLFPGPVKFQLLILMAQRLADMGRGELLASLAEFIPGEVLYRAWFPLRGKSSLRIRKKCFI